MAGYIIDALMSIGTRIYVIYAGLHMQRTAMKTGNLFPHLLDTPPNNKSTVGPILPKSSLPFKA